MSRALPVLEFVEPAPATAAGPQSEGWTRRFVAGGERLLEAARLYRELRFEVRLEKPGPEDLREECGDCRLALEHYRIVYTRRSA